MLPTLLLMDSMPSAIMKFQQIEHKLVWYEKHGDKFIGECTLNGMTLSDLQHLFEQSSQGNRIKIL
jgi:hypothetical protein